MKGDICTILMINVSVVVFVPSTSCLKLILTRFLIIFPFISMLPNIGQKMLQNTGKHGKKGKEGNIDMKSSNPLSTNPTKWSNSLKQIVGKSR